MFQSVHNTLIECRNITPHKHTHLALVHSDGLPLSLFPPACPPHSLLLSAPSLFDLSASSRRCREVVGSKPTAVPTVFGVFLLLWLWLFFVCVFSFVE
jgi:hypothetical protein